MKVLLFASRDWYLYNFRLSLARTLRASGCEVVLISPPGEYSQRLVEAGFRWIPLPMARHGINPLKELGALLRLVRVYRREQPSLVHHFTLKSVLYGSIAARLAGVRAIINAVTGLGYVFTDNGWKARILRKFVWPLYRVALRNTRVIFQNPDDRKSFIGAALLSEKYSYVIRGSGVDVSRFTPSPQRTTDSKQVLLAARLLRAKGIAEYVEAVSLVCQEMPEVLFLIAGDSDPGNPDSIEEEVIKRWKRATCVKFIGHCDDMPKLLNQVDLVVLPSYREGVPRVLLEAAASGLALVASDVPGCREVVRHGVNGVLVPIKNGRALADAIMTLLRDDKLREKMGKMSRNIACDEFADERVIAETLGIYRLVGLHVTTGAAAETALEIAQPCARAHRIG